MGAKREKCLSKGCGGAVRCRGLCERCYFAARRLVKSGEVPGWDWLVDHGLAKSRVRTPLVHEVKRRLKQAGGKGSDRIPPCPERSGAADP